MDAGLVKQFRKEVFDFMRENGSYPGARTGPYLWEFEELEKMQAEGLIERVADDTNPFRLSYRLKPEPTQSRE